MADTAENCSIALLATGSAGGIELTTLIKPSNAPWKAHNGE